MHYDFYLITANVLSFVINCINGNGVKTAFFNEKSPSSYLTCLPYCSTGRRPTR